MIDCGNIVTKTWDSFIDLIGLPFVSDPLPGRQSDKDAVLDVCGYRQTQSYTCGFVAGLMVLHTFRPKARIDAFWKAVRPTERNGVSNTRLITALRSSGIGVRVVKDLTFAALAQAIERGFPVITLVKTRKADTLHWVVAYGVGEKPKCIYVAGNGVPYLSKKVFFWNDFRHDLAPERIGLVCWRRKRK